MEQHPTNETATSPSGALRSDVFVTSLRGDTINARRWYFRGNLILWSRISSCMIHLTRLTSHPVGLLAPVPKNFGSDVTRQRENLDNLSISETYAVPAAAFNIQLPNSTFSWLRNYLFSADFSHTFYLEKFWLFNTLLRSGKDMVWLLFRIWRRPFGKLSL